MQMRQLKGSGATMHATVLAPMPHLVRISASSPSSAARERPPQQLLQAPIGAARLLLQASRCVLACGAAVQAHGTCHVQEPACQALRKRN